MNIALATDHAGFEQLKSLQKYLEEQGHSCVNFGPAKMQPDDDYVDFIKPAAKAVASGQCQMGVVLGGSGQGEAIAANRVKGVRCAVYYGPAVPKGLVDIGGRISHDPLEILRLSRRHNNANMLSIGVRFVGQKDILTAVDIWLNTEFDEQEVRHVRRNVKLDEAN